MATASFPALVLVREPADMFDVFSQVLQHPEYESKISFATKYSFKTICVGGYSPGVAPANDAWARTVWRHLYVGGAKPGAFV